jgi:predicted MFS family arabinose efflux permease
LGTGTKTVLHSRLLLAVLAVSVISTWLVTVTFQVLLFDIAKEFTNGQVGTAGFTASVGAISGAVFGLLVSFLSVRYNHKALLLIGLSCTGIAAVGYYFAPNFHFLLLPNIGVGAGIALVTGMAYALLGEYYPLQKRGRAIGVLVSAISLAYIIGAPTVALIANAFGWRATMPLLSLPFTLVSFIAGIIIIPNRKQPVTTVEKEPFFTGCKLAFSNRSSAAALFVTMLMLCESGIVYYSVAFFREQYNFNVDGGSFFVLLGNIVGTVGGFVSGLLVNRVGRKRLGTITLVMAGTFTLSFTLMPTLELSYGLGILRFWFSSMAFTAGGALILEQIPKFRSTMTSLNAAFMNLGMLLASLVAGLVLNLYSYQILGVVLGVLGILGAAVWIVLVKEPIKEAKSLTPSD